MIIGPWGYGADVVVQKDALGSYSTVIRIRFGEGEAGRQCAFRTCHDLQKHRRLAVDAVTAPPQPV